VVVLIERSVYATAARSPLTAYGNVRVGPTAMSFIRSLCFLRLHFYGSINQEFPANQIRLAQ